MGSGIGGPRSGSGANGPDVTPKPAGRTGGPVEVGIVYTTDQEQLGGSLGTSLDTGNQLVQAKAMVAYLNANGGLNGRKIAPVYTAFRLTSTAPYSQTMEEICQSWTRDHKVVAGIWVATSVPTAMAECLAKRGVYFTNVGFYMKDSVDYQRAPTLVDAAHLATDVASKAYVDGLAASGFFAKGDKVGLLHFDVDGARRAYRNALEPALNAKGLKVDVAYEIPFPTSTPGISDSVSAVQSAVLRMRTENVNKVLFLCPFCASYFMQAAESQQYRPRYGLSSFDTPWLLADDGNAPAAQLAGSATVGWFPLLDVAVANAPAPNATFRLCEKIMNPTGQAIKQYQKYVAYSFCDALLQLRAAAARLGSITGVGLVQNAERLGSTYQSPLLLGPASFRSDRRFGVSTLRALTYVASCHCYKYTGPARRVG